jgi:hypothetical protein
MIFLRGRDTRWYIGVTTVTRRRKSCKSPAINHGILPSSFCMIHFEICEQIVVRYRLGLQPKRFHQKLVSWVVCDIWYYVEVVVSNSKLYRVGSLLDLA